MRLVGVHVREEVRRWAGAAILPHPHRRTWIVRLETDRDTTAEGEIAWLPRHGPTPDIASLVAAWARGQLGHPLPDSQVDPALPGPVAWAITTALATLQSAWPASTPVPENGLLHAESGSPIDVARNWSAHMAAQPQIRTWKVKVGRLSFAEDLARLEALTLPPGVCLRLDPNQSWGALDPNSVADALAGLPIDYIEEPVAWPALAGWARTGLPCAADESVSLVDLDTLADAGLCAVVIKPSTLGALGTVTALIDRATTRGLQVVVSSALEGPIGRAHLEAIARTLPEPRAAAGLARHTLQDAPVSETPILHCTLTDDPLRDAARRFADSVAVETARGQMTFAEWDHEADVRARALGDRTGARLAVEIADLEGAIRFAAIASPVHRSLWRPARGRVWVPGCGLAWPLTPPLTPALQLTPI